MILLPQEQAQKTSRLILVAGAAVTFAFWFPLDDPMNVPKMFVLLVFATWISATTMVAYFYQRPKSLLLGQWALLAFIIGLFAAAILTDVRFTAFFGATHRNNGFLSYLALAALAFTAMMSFNLKCIRYLRLVFLIVGGISTLYGLIQTTGNDPFAWRLLYSPVIGTQGNPDFFSALVGVCSIATVWLLLVKEELRWRISGLVLLLLELFIVKRSGSFQGLLAFAIGATLLLVVKIWQIQKRVGLISLVVAGLGGILVFLGVINKGPIASYLYRASLENRKDYWQAAIGMFKAHPLFGVGLERFAENYPRYAPQIQVIPGQNSDNAHNVFLQLMATGGLIVIVHYLFLVGAIFWSTVRSTRISTGQAQIETVALFSIWFALLLISFISIDNLGVTVWFWISGGALYAITSARGTTQVALPSQAKGKGKSVRRVQGDNSTYVSPIVSLVLTVIVLAIMVPIVQTSGSLYNLSGNKDRLSKEQFASSLEEVSNNYPRNAQTLTTLADLALRVTDSELALKFAKLILEKDPKSQSGNLLNASAYELSKKYELAIPYRLQLMELDPWNAQNMLQIVRDYLNLKDLSNAKAMADKIAEFKPRRGEANTAATLLKG